MGRQTYKINYGTPRFLIGVERNFFGAQDPETPIRSDIGGYARGYEYYTARDLSLIHIWGQRFKVLLQRNHNKHLLCVRLKILRTRKWLAF